jgi:glycosyltransferase involved in cell wall biosynthesis
MRPPQRHVVVNGRFLQRPVTGVERFALETLKAWHRRLQAPDAGAMPTFEIVAPQGTPRPEALALAPFQTIGRHQGHVWEQLDLAWHTRGRPLLNLCNTAPVLKQRQWVVIHDAAVFSAPQAFSRSFRLAYKAMHHSLSRGRSHILTVSQFSKTDLMRCLHLPADRIQVIPESAEHVLHQAADLSILDTHGLRTRPYVLAVSSMAAHKNFQLVLDALARLDAPPFDVVIAGGLGPSRVFGLGGRVHSEQIKWVGYVSDAQLRALYEHALCFVFPSVYEGFGIPPLEAMQCGCPVLASEAASIPEVCGDAALYFNPGDAAQLASLLMRVAADAKLRATLSQRGLAQAARLTWSQTATRLAHCLLDNARQEAAA